MPKAKYVLIKKAGEETFIPQLIDGLSEMQEIVGGYVDVIRLPGKIDCWVNDSGLIDGLPINFYLTNKKGKIMQPVAGDVIFASYDEEGETNSLSLTQTAYILNNLRQGTDETGEVVYGFIKEEE